MDDDNFNNISNFTMAKLNWENKMQSKLCQG
jgi:hypothetical protein